MAAADLPDRSNWIISSKTAMSLCLHTALCRYRFRVCVDGWFEMHDMFGHLPMKDLLQPAISYAREGFPVTEVIAYALKQGTEILKEYPNIKEVYMPSGKAPVKGEILKIRFWPIHLIRLSKADDLNFTEDLSPRISLHL